MWYPRPAEIVPQSYGGTANMGTIPTYDGTETTRVGRFSLDVDVWCLVFARAHFLGGTGTATMTLYVDSRLGRNHDSNLWAWTSAGTTGNDVNFRIVPEELMHWSFRRGDELVFTWTNPDTGNMAWGLEVALADASNA